jgi:hypothetical protein
MSFYTCEVCFLTKAGARRAARKFKAYNISMKVFDEVRDECSDETVFAVIYQDKTEVLAGIVIPFKSIVDVIVSQCDGSADCFDVNDVVPSAEHYGFVANA